MPLSVPLVLRPGYPDRHFTVHVHRVHWDILNVSTVLTADDLADDLEDNARRGLRMVSECAAAEQAEADVEVTELPAGGAEAVARLLCVDEVCAAVAERYHRDADEDIEAEAARAWAATKLQGQSVELLRLRGEVERAMPGKTLATAKDMLASVLAAQQERTGGATDQVVLLLDEAAHLARESGLLSNDGSESDRQQVERLIRQGRRPYPAEPTGSNWSVHRLTDLDGAATATTWAPLTPPSTVDLTPEELVRQTEQLSRAVAAGTATDDGVRMLALRCREVARRYSADAQPPDRELDDRAGQALLDSVGYRPRAVPAGEVCYALAAAKDDWPLQTLPDALPQDDTALVLVYSCPTPGLSSLLEAVRTGDDAAVRTETATLVRALGWIAAEGGK